MNLIQFVRRYILVDAKGKPSPQPRLAALMSVTQASISRWEEDSATPGFGQIQKLRAGLIAERLPWDDSWAFNVPDEIEAAKIRERVMALLVARGEAV